MKNNSESALIFDTCSYVETLLFQDGLWFLFLNLMIFIFYFVAHLIKKNKDQNTFLSS